jgi:transcriptional regulator NrdR family protein
LVGQVRRLSTELLEETTMDNCTHKKSYVIDSRDNEFGTRRRRECADCGHRWTTIEMAFEDNIRGVDPWMVYRKKAIRKHLQQQLKGIDL